MITADTTATTNRQTGGWEAYRAAARDLKHKERRAQNGTLTDAVTEENDAGQR